MSNHPPSRYGDDEDEIDDDDDMAVDPALAAAMGFSGFGAQPSANKRRKFRHDDAIVDVAGGGGGGGAKGNSNGAGKPVASGGNKIALGMRKPGRKAGTTDQQREEAQGTSVAAQEIEQEKPGDSEPPPRTDTSSAEEQKQQQMSRDEVLRSLGTETQEELEALRNGVRLPGGDVVYFSPKFLEDPWAGMG